MTCSNRTSIFRSLSGLRQQLHRPAVAIGNFDGVHLGHQSIIARTCRLANRAGVQRVALTFKPHPVRYFRPGAPPFRLTTSEQRAELLLSYGIDAVVELPFDAALASLSPDRFVDRVIVHGLGATHVVVGEDFAFGKARAGTTADLIEMTAKHGITTTVCEHITQDAQSISSTRVRREIISGRCEAARRLLGRPYRLQGVVEQGDQRGRRLGFPTANFRAVQPVLPPNGVYATTLHTKCLPPLNAITNIGQRPTFDGHGIIVESFVLDHDGDLDLYDRPVDLDLWSFVRPERKFTTTNALISQVRDDIETVKTFFALTNSPAAINQ